MRGVRHAARLTYAVHAELWVANVHSADARGPAHNGAYRATTSAVVAHDKLLRAREKRNVRHPRERKSTKNNMKE